MDEDCFERNHRKRNHVSGLVHVGCCLHVKVSAVDGVFSGQWSSLIYQLKCSPSPDACPLASAHQDQTRAAGTHQSACNYDASYSGQPRTVQHDDGYDAALYYQQQQYRQSSPSWQIMSPFGHRGVQLASPSMQQAQARQAPRAIPQDPHDCYDYMETRREQGRRRCDQQAFVPIQRPQQQLQQTGQQQPLRQAHRDSSSSSRQPAVAPDSAAPSRAAAPAGLPAHANRHLQAAGQQRTTASPAAQQQAATRAAGAATAPMRSLGADSQPRYRAPLLQVLQGSGVVRPGKLTAPTPHRDQAKPAAATGAGTPATSVHLATSILGSANCAWCV